MYGYLEELDVRLPGKGYSNSHGARPVHLIITMLKWIRTSRLSIKNFISVLWYSYREFGKARSSLKIARNGDSG